MLRHLKGSTLTAKVRDIDLKTMQKAPAEQYISSRVQVKRIKHDENPLLETGSLYSARNATDFKNNCEIVARKGVHEAFSDFKNEILYHSYITWLQGP